MKFFLAKPENCFLREIGLNQFKTGTNPLI